PDTPISSSKRVASLTNVWRRQKEQDRRSFSDHLLVDCLYWLFASTLQGSGSGKAGPCDHYTKGEHLELSTHRLTRRVARCASGTAHEGKGSYPCARPAQCRTSSAANGQDRQAVSLRGDERHGESVGPLR